MSVIFIAKPSFFLSDRFLETIEIKFTGFLKWMLKFESKLFLLKSLKLSYVYKDALLIIPLIFLVFVKIFSEMNSKE